MIKRVYHPTLNSWNDVPAADVAKWTKNGWEDTKPAHVTEPVVGGPAPESQPEPKADKKA